MGSYICEYFATMWKKSVELFIWSTVTYQTVAVETQWIAKKVLVIFTFFRLVGLI